MKKAFTLIELLVVIAIIAILAAILFPVFAQAKLAAKKTTDLSNSKNLGTALQIYTTDFDDTLPTAYFHRAFNPANGGTNSGYIHWSSLIYPYVKNWDIFVSPGDKLGGHAPTCFASGNNNQGKGFPAGQQADRCPVQGTTVPGTPAIGGFIVDDQAPRLSYTANSAVLPRLRNVLDQNAGVKVVSTTELDSPSNTIAIAGLVDNLQCLNGQSLGTGIRNSSHRSTNAFTRNAANTQQWLGENTDATVSPLFALNYSQVTTGSNNIFQLCQTNPAGTFPLITYHSAFRWSDGDNYTMTDGSAKYRKFAATVNPNNYMWGPRVYTTSTGQTILNPLNNQPVTN